MSRVVVGPFNRVEGDLEVSIDIADANSCLTRALSWANNLAR